MFRFRDRKENVADVLDARVGLKVIYEENIQHIMGSLTLNMKHPFGHV